MEIADLDQLTVHTETKDILLSQIKEMVDANDLMTNPDYLSLRRRRGHLFRDRWAAENHVLHSLFKK